MKPDIFNTLASALHPASAGNSYPSNPGASLLLADIRLMLSQVDPGTFLGHCIQNGLQEYMPIKDIVQQVYEQIQDNREGVARCIGIRLVEKIEKYKSLI